MTEPSTFESTALRGDSDSEARLTQAERTEISDQKMFEATVKLVVEKGPAATSLSEVGVLAGYSRGLAGHRFGSKDNLYSFVLRRLGEIWVQQLSEVTDGHTGLRAIEKTLDQHYQFCVDAPDYVSTFYMLWFESVNIESELNRAICNIHKRRHDDIVKWIVESDDINDETKSNADSIASFFCASALGIIYYWLNDTSDLKQAKVLHDGLKQAMVQYLS